MMTPDEIKAKLESRPRQVICTYKDGREFWAWFAGFADRKSVLVFYGSPWAPAEVPISMLDRVEIKLQ